MENNLKFALDETDDEMTHFAGRYQTEKKKITTEIIYVIKNVIIFHFLKRIQLCGKNYSHQIK